MEKFKVVFEYIIENWLRIGVAICGYALAISVAIQLLTYAIRQIFQ